MQANKTLVDEPPEEPASPRTEPPEELASPRTKLVYLYLATSGPTPVSDLQAALDVPKTTLLPILGTLDEHGLLSRTDAGVTVN